MPKTILLKKGSEVRRVAIVRVSRKNENFIPENVVAKPRTVKKNYGFFAPNAGYSRCPRANPANWA